MGVALGSSWGYVPICSVPLIMAGVLEGPEARSGPVMVTGHYESKQDLLTHSGIKSEVGDAPHLHQAI